MFSIITASIMVTIIFLSIYIAIDFGAGWEYVKFSLRTYAFIALVVFAFAMLLGTMIIIFV